MGNTTEEHLSGIGIRSQHIQEVLNTLPAIGFLEAHSENYFGTSRARDWLIQLSEHYPISLHGVGLSLGRYDELNHSHLTQLNSLIEDINPQFISEHLAWSAYSHRHVPDLLPLPLNNQSLAIVCDHIKQMQDYLQRQIYIENPSNYAIFENSCIDEAEFLNTLVHNSGCGLLMDINNIYISAFNVGLDPHAYIKSIEACFVKQYHLAGHIRTKINNSPLLIDSHNQPIADEVWKLYEFALWQQGNKPTIIEWDSDLPKLSVLIDAANRIKNTVSTRESILSPNTPYGWRRNSGRICDPPLRTQHIYSSSEFLTDIFTVKSTHNGFITNHQQRIKVYQTNCFSAIKQYMESVYPATINALGSDFSAPFLHQFIAEYQPQFGNLHSFGAELAQYANNYELLNHYPYIPYLIQFEWAIHHAYYADNQSVTMPQTNDEQHYLLNQPIKLNDSVSVFKFHYPIHQIWKQSLPSYAGEFDIKVTEDYIELIAIFKRESVEIKALKASEYELLVLLKDKTSLQHCIDQLSENQNSSIATQALIFVLQNPLLAFV